MKLITVDANTPIIDFDHKEPLDTLFKKIQIAYNKDICCKNVDFGIPIEIKNKIYPVKLQTEFTFGCSCGAYVRERRVFLILFNKNKKIFFENRLTTKKKLSHNLHKYFQNSEYETLKYKFQHEKISLMWDKEISKEDFNMFINLIIDWYFSEVKIICKTRFNKSIDSINKSELKIIKDNYPFNIIIERLEIVEHSND